MPARIGVRLTGLCTIGLAWLATSALSQPQPEPETLMEAKLRHSQALLRSIAIEDFAALQRDANTLSELAVDAIWQVDKSEEYRRESAEFERAAHQLGQAAKDKNLDAAALAYLNVSFSCVSCHDYLRDADKLGDAQVDVLALGAKEDGDFNYWMKRKLQLAQDSFAAISIADFKTLASAGRRMQALSQVEGWARRTDAKEYRTQLRAFESANERLLEAAEKENAEAATLAFTNLTLSCVNCHKALRQAE